MNKSVLTHLAASVLLAGSTLFASAVEPTPQSQPAVATTFSADAPRLPFATPLKWTSTDVLIKPITILKPASTPPMQQG